MKNLPADQTAGFLPPMISDYSLVRCIGLGSYGKVWLAQSVIGAYRALKIIDRRTFPMQRPFDREFRGIEKFEPVSRTHPGLVSILHIGRNDQAGYFYYVMELADDISTGQKIDPGTYTPRTLNSDLATRGTLPTADCLKLGQELSSALGHLHKHGLVHRDIKPSNIIFINGLAKFADIGLVSEIGEGATFVGTEGYVPPEGPGRPAADLYGLGKVLYQASTGKNLEDFPQLPAASGNPSPAVEKKFYEIILKICDLNPRRRFQTGEEIASRLASLSDGKPPVTLSAGGLEGAAHPKETLKVALLYQRNLALDGELGLFIEEQLKEAGCAVYTDKHPVIGLAEAGEIEEQLSGADIIIPLFSDAAVQSELLAYEIEIGHQSALRHPGKPRFIPIVIKLSHLLPAAIAVNLNNAPALSWSSSADNSRLLTELARALRRPAIQSPDRPKFEAIGGAVPLDSRFYVERAADLEFREAIARADSIVLIKGARQMGKTSLLARGLQQARGQGMQVVLSDFQQLNSANLESLDNFYRALGNGLADQLQLDSLPEDSWDPRRGSNTNFERYLTREVLAKIPGTLIWGLDEVDRLFTSTFGTEVFGLFRSWHNKRALDPAGPWSKLVLAIAYATEAHLFITDLVQSPFNVGTRLLLQDFNQEQVAELNRRHGAPLPSSAALASFQELLGGQPFLVRRGLHDLATQRLDMTAFEAAADRDEGPFGDHLRRLLLSLVKDPGLVAIVRGILNGEPCPTEESFYRLRSAGLVVGESPAKVDFRCQLYKNFLCRHLN